MNNRLTAVQKINNNNERGQVDSPEVVEVVEFRRGQEGQVVSTVGDGGADQSQAVPQGGGGHVGAQEHRPHCHRQHVGDLTARRNNTCSFIHSFRVKTVKP